MTDAAKVRSSRPFATALMVVIGLVGGVAISVAARQVYDRNQSDAAPSLELPEVVEAPGVPWRPKAPRVQPAAVERDDTDEAIPEDETDWYQVHQSKLEAHRSTPIRSGWSEAAASDFEADFGEGCESGLQCKVSAVDCRWQSCVVSVHWDSYATATTTFASLLHRSYKQNCAVTITLPARLGEEDREVVGEFLLECQELLASADE